MGELGEGAGRRGDWTHQTPEEGEDGGQAEVQDKGQVSRPLQEPLPLFLLHLWDGGHMEAVPGGAPWKRLPPFPTAKNNSNGAGGGESIRHPGDGGGRSRGAGNGGLTASGVQQVGTRGCWKTFMPAQHGTSI